MKATETDVLKAVCNKAKTDGQVSEVHISQLSAAFGSRFTKAWETLKENRVKKYVFKPSSRTVWIVVGKERDYLVMPAADFCTCDDFYFRVMDKQVHLCYHLIAQKLAEALGGYDLVEEEDDLYDSLMEEWRTVTT
jgi:predicted nucleic acid-binding Zn finger protein